MNKYASDLPKAPQYSENTLKLYREGKFIEYGIARQNEVREALNRSSGGLYQGEVNTVISDPLIPSWKSNDDYGHPCASFNVILGFKHAFLRSNNYEQLQEDYNIVQENLYGST